MYTMSQINHIKDLSSCGYRISEISKETGADPKTIRKYLTHAFCGARRTLMRFRADAMQSITDAPKRSILLFSSSAGLLLYSASSPA